jgi:hypothetical protein
MLYFPKTRVAVSNELPIAVGASIQAEGLALVADNTGGVFGVKPSIGDAADVFMGVSISQEFPLLAMPKVEEQTQPAANTVTLARTPITGTLAVTDTTSGLFLVAGTDYTVSGKVVTLLAATTGHTHRITYKFVPTALEAESIQGDIYPGGAAGTRFGQCGLLKSGAVYTTEFDSAVDWSQPAPIVTTGANGQFTIGGTGVVVPCQVIATPSVMYPYLGLMINAA